MSKIITRELYNAVEVHIEEFSDSALIEEAESRGLRLVDEDDLVMPAEVLYQWGRLCMADQGVVMADEVVALVKEAIRRAA